MERIFNTTICSLYEDRDEFVGVKAQSQKALLTAVVSTLTTLTYSVPGTNSTSTGEIYQAPSHCGPGGARASVKATALANARGEWDFTDDGGIEDQSDTILNRVIIILASTREATQHPEARGDCLLAKNLNKQVQRRLSQPESSSGSS